MDQEAATDGAERVNRECAGAAAHAGELLRVGETCWRIDTAQRLGVIVDASAYYAALRKAIAAAQDTVLIIGWDVDSRTPLCPERRPKDGLPQTLLAYLKAVLRKRPSLNVFIVAWDFAVIYALEREFLPAHKFSQAHPRLHFLLDSDHAVGASHHQKLVVIDDGLAFVGGIDLTIRRWDRPAHASSDGGRSGPQGHAYAPIHDLQLCLDGPAARALAEQARRRLERALSALAHPPFRPPLPVSPRPARELWPHGVEVDFADTRVGISRTFTGRDPHEPSVREIAELTQRALRAAERYVYIENQYLTSSLAAAALLDSLRKPRGPHIVVVLPRYECGWLERSSMGVLRARVLKRLRSADVHGRLHLYYPKLPDERLGSMNVHSKLILVDGTLLKVGSANLSNRSQGLDTECDVSVEVAAQDPGAAARTQAAIERVLRRLLSEHLALSEDEVAARLGRGATLVELIEGQRGRPRCLEQLPEEHDQESIDLGALGDWVVDPERPMGTESFLQTLLPLDLRYPLLRSAVASLALLLPVLGCGLLREHSSALAVWFEALRDAPGAGWYVLAAYLIGCLAFIPISVLLAVTVIAFGPLAALQYALLGSMSAAAAAYALGRAFRGATLRRLRRRPLLQLQHGMRERALRTTLITRLLPAGNFTASNLLSGALQAPFGRFLLGNLLGLGFGTSFLILFAQRLERALRAPNVWNLLSAVLAGVVMVGSCYALARVFSSSEADSAYAHARALAAPPDRAGSPRA